MDRALSDEEKIKRAIEISQRRNRVYDYQRTAKVNVNNKKDYKLFKRMILQILICLVIYLIFYMVTTTNYIFSDDLINQTSSILNYDIDFRKLYNESYNKIQSIISNWGNKENSDAATQTTDNLSDEINQLTENNETANTVNSENITEASTLSQMEQDAITAKEQCDFVKPLSGKITSEFGQREVTNPVMSADHKGIDISAKEGTKIKSAIDGQVEEADKNSDYGNYVKIKNGDVLTVYAHCKKLKVSKGDKVKKGDVIATVGSTGKSTGPHLHFEIRLSDRYINPKLIINF